MSRRSLAEERLIRNQKVAGSNCNLPGKLPENPAGGFHPILK